MTLYDILENINTETFIINDYEKVGKTLQLIPKISTENVLLDDVAKEKIFNGIVQKIISDTYCAVASLSVISSVIVNEGVDIYSIFRLVSAVCDTIKQTSHFYDCNFSTMLVSNISVIMVENPDKFEFDKIFQHINFCLKLNPDFKLILVGTNKNINNRILPVLLKYTNKK